MSASWEKGWTGYYSKIEKPKKMTHKLEFTENPEGTIIGINTHTPNAIIKEALLNNSLSFIDSQEVKPECKIQNSKIDFLINKDTLLEVKNVSSLMGDTAFFPDTVSERALKHLKDLIALKRKGYRTILVFLIQRNDVNSFRAGIEFHEEYAELLEWAINNNAVEVFPLAIDIDLKSNSIEISKKEIEFKFN